LVLVVLIGGIPRSAQGRWQLFSEFGLTVRYDTNIDLTTTGPSDMVYLVQPLVGMKYEGTDMGITASYRASAEFYATHQNLNGVSQELSLETDFSRMLSAILPKESTAHVRELLLYTPILPDFQSLVTPSPDMTTGGVRTPRTNTLRNVFDIDWSMPFSILTKMTLEYKNTDTQYQDPALVDSQTNGVTIDLSHALSRTDTLTAASSYSRFNPYGGAISHLYTLTVGDQHGFSPVLTGSASLGVGAAVLPDRNQAQYSTNGSLSISSKITGRLQLNAEAGRHFSTDSGITSVVLITDMGRISLDQQFTKFLSANVALNVARNYSLGAQKDTGVLIDVHSQGASIGLNYQIASWLVSGLEYQYLHQQTAGSFQGNLIRNQYSFTLRANWS
jgi:hypothetical protein